MRALVAQRMPLASIKKNLRRKVHRSQKTNTRDGEEVPGMEHSHQQSHLMKFFSRGVWKILRMKKERTSLEGRECDMTGELVKSHVR